MGHRIVVSVCGSSGVIDPQVYEMAKSVGRGLSEAGISVLCGGRDGVMEALCHGISLAKGDKRGCSMALLPGEDRSEANNYADYVLPTGIGYARNAMVALMGEVVIVIAGATGTLSEAAYAWNYGKPIIALSSSGGVAADIAGRILDERYDTPIISCQTPQQVVTETLKILKESGRIQS
jgi:uncharacterized protein (TIGR00725 family)